MSVQALKRIAFLAVAALFAATPTLLAGFPAARTGPRMVFDDSTKTIVLFGGLTINDLGTARSYELDETWIWNGERWIQQYPAHVPPGRDSHVMVYDSSRHRAVMFGGRGAAGELTDTWIYENGDWSELATPNAPPKRILAGAAFDAIRDRVVLFGGTTLVTTGKTGSFTPLYDTWEFDGTTWTRTIESGPQVQKPNLVFDESRNQLLLIGINEKFETQMYAYDGAARVWNKLTPETLPPCVNEAAATYNRNEQKIFLLGGVCSVEGNRSPSTEEVYMWDGTTWTKTDTKTQLFRVSNPGIAFDAERNAVVVFGGTTAFSVPRHDTYRFAEGDWVTLTDTVAPGPRSLFGMDSDPANKTLYLVGGLTDLDYFSDFWKYHDGAWEKIAAEKGPQCLSPLAAFDTDRSKLVVVCPDSSIFEFDGTAWTAVSDPKKKPPARRFSNLVYDRNAKKTILFGGFDDQGEYTSRTWSWDGSAWTELKKRRPHARSLASMWYDPILKKTVVFGGLGRRDTNTKIERYEDMWAFDGSGWSEIKPSAFPATRYGAQAGVDPRTGHTFLFGGIRTETDQKGLKKQVYADDTWEWDGSTWRLVPTAANAPARENGALIFNPSTERMELFFGWSGFYRSDVWALTQPKTWVPVAQ